MSRHTASLMREEIDTGVGPDQEPIKHYGVVTGEVIDLADPLMLGRVRLRIPSIDSLDLSCWARVAVPMAGPGHGAYSPPNIGDQVLVVFENGDLCSPYVIGSLFNARSFPPLPSPLPQIRVQRTITGNQVVFTEMPPTVTIQSGPTPPGRIPAPVIPGAYQTIALDPLGVQVSGTMITLEALTMITLKVGATTITLSPIGVNISAPAVTISSGATKISSGATDITGTVNLKGTASILGPCLVNTRPVMTI